MDAAAARTDGPRPLALVTGGLHRIGAAIAARLAAAGYDLVLHSGHGGAPEVSLRDAASEHGAAVHVVMADLTAPSAAQTLVDATLAAAGRLPDGLVNNASLFVEGDVTQADEAVMAQVFAANMTAPVQLIRLLAAAAQERGAAFSAVNILDQRVRNPVADQFAYTLSKQALWQATRTLARALAPNARVNGVAPGLTLPTPDYDDGQMARVAAHMPLERLPQPADIADAVLYLLNARAVTGQTIFVDGGANLRGFERDFAYM